MRRGFLLHCFLLAFCLAGTLHAAQIPVPVSPGSASHAALIETRTPTFSWSAVAEADGYELVVYRVEADDESATTLTQVFRHTLPSGSTSWTPSAANGLEYGGEYAWAVRVVSGSDAPWSSAHLFSIEVPAGIREIRDALELLKRSGAEKVEEEPQSLGQAPEDVPEDNAVRSDPSRASSDVIGTGVEIGSSSIHIDGDPVVTASFDQDSLAAITCPEGHLIVQTGSGWACSPRCGSGDFISCYSGPLSTIGVGECRVGTRACDATGSGFGPCLGEVPPAPEVCDDLDNDCDGTPDEEAVDATSWYPDTDGDGQGDASAAPTASCDMPAGFVANHTDCDDTTDRIYLGARELCDALDNDCDGTADNECAGACTGSEVSCINNCVLGCGPDFSCITDCPATCGADPLCSDAFNDLLVCGINNSCHIILDPVEQEACLRELCPAEVVNYYGPECSNGEQRQCGSTDVGACEFGTQTCSGWLWGSCIGNIEPVAESCDDDIDNDCDGQTDESGRFWYPDGDGDGHGDDRVGGFDTCTPPVGYVDNNTDCDDSRDDVNPDAEEVCGDLVDNDCNGYADTGVELVWHPDADLDGYGDQSVAGTCEELPGHVANSGDCDDGNEAINPGAAEICDATDWDCDGGADTDSGGALTRSCYSGDPTTEGVGECSAGTQTCSAGSWGLCDGETVPSSETCDGLDEDCNGVVDDPFLALGLGTACGTGACSGGTVICTLDGGNVECSTAGNASPEVCDGVDNDCDGSVDEGGVCPIEHCGPITADQSWSPHPSGHEITCTVTVAGPLAPTLTIADGVEVRFHTGTSLEVGTTDAGGIVVSGGTGAGVLFTSDAASPAAGDWYALHLGSNLAGASLAGLTVEYGTNGIEAWNNSAVAITLDSVAVRDSLQAGLKIIESRVSIDSSAISNNGTQGIDCASSPCLSSLTNTTITGNGDVPVRLPDGSSAAALQASSTFTGNANDWIAIDGPTAITTDALWQPLDVPYRLGADLVVQSMSLTIGSGAELRFADSMALTVANGAELTATNTTFDSAGSGIPGAWDGISFSAGATGSLSGCEVAHGGGNGSGNVALGGPGISITGSTLRNSSTYGLFCSGGCAGYTPPPSGNTYSGNASGATN